MKELVKLWARRYKSGEYAYCLRYVDQNGKRIMLSLGHLDKRKAEMQRRQKELELLEAKPSIKVMKLSELRDDYAERTKTQIRASTAYLAKYAMNTLIKALGDIDSAELTYKNCERFQQYCIDSGLSVASANTHIRMVKRVFSLAVKRGQLEKNPFLGFARLKVAKSKIRIILNDEFERLIFASNSKLWNARLLLAKTAGLRKGEILNLTLGDIDFAKKVVMVQPKKETESTWKWEVKDVERRELPLIDELVQLLVDIQTELPEGQPYILLAPERYQKLLELQKQGKLIDRVRNAPDNNFRRTWQSLCKRAKVAEATFHDLRRTCITEWLENGLAPHEVQQLAGHADIKTTMEYYVAVRREVVDKARAASKAALSADFGAYLVRTGQNGQNQALKARNKKSQVSSNKELAKIGATGLEPATS